MLRYNAVVMTVSMVLLDRGVGNPFGIHCLLHVVGQTAYWFIYGGYFVYYLVLCYLLKKQNQSNNKFKSTDKTAVNLAAQHLSRLLKRCEERLMLF